MKILKCLACDDLVPMSDEEKTCRCGKCRGRYVNGRKVVFGGSGEVYGVKGLDYYSGQDWRDKMYQISEDSAFVEKED